MPALFDFLDDFAHKRWQTPGLWLVTPLSVTTSLSIRLPPAFSRSLRTDLNDVIFRFRTASAWIAAREHGIRCDDFAISRWRSAMASTRAYRDK
jgi:hypothetical protein